MDRLSHDVVELLSAMALVIGGGIFLALSARARRVHPVPLAAIARRPPGAGPVGPESIGAGASRGADEAGGQSPSVGRSLSLVITALSVGAAVIHLAAAPSHFSEIGDLAAGFLISAAFQALWIRWWLADPTTRTVAIGIVGNLAIVAAWVFTRTIGLPVGEFAGSAEPIGYPDAVSVVFELLLVVGLVIHRLGIDSALSRRRPTRDIASIAVVPIIGLVLVLTSLATVALASGMEHGGTDASMPGDMAQH